MICTSVCGSSSFASPDVLCTFLSFVPIYSILAPVGQLFKSIKISNYDIVATFARSIFHFIYLLLNLTHFFVVRLWCRIQFEYNKISHIIPQVIEKRCGQQEQTNNYPTMIDQQNFKKSVSTERYDFFLRCHFANHQTHLLPSIQKFEALLTHSVCYYSTIQIIVITSAAAPSTDRFNQHVLYKFERNVPCGEGKPMWKK